MQLKDKSQAYRVILVQLALTFLAALLLLAVGWVPAYSGLLGGVIAVLASAVFAKLVFVPYQAQETGRLLGGLYKAELLKLLLIGLLFAGVILWIHPLSAGALFGVFLLVQMAPMLVLHYTDESKSR